MTISVLTVPLTPVVLVVGFVLFGSSTSVKPFPPGSRSGWVAGSAVMIDDVIAGLYALALLLVARPGMALTPGVRLVVLGVSQRADR